jgi:glycosyltransferase involved in cell wall biosynthesis
MPDLDVIIPSGPNEEFTQKTIADVLENSTADTGVIVILDGWWPAEPIPDHPKVTVVHHVNPIGQRAAVNEGARISQAKFVMKLDAHCSVAPGFDTQLINDCRRRNWTLVPEMWNLHVLDWKCTTCGETYYQADRPDTCCEKADFEKVIVWKPRKRRNTYQWNFDNTLHFQYWRDRKPKGKIVETMSFIGCCWFIHREQYWKLEGLDESHGSWGQVGTELACKTWLSGGKLLTDRNTWMAHCFRTKSKYWKFPYEISGNEQDRARQYSKDLWLNDKWPKAIHPLSWLVDRFAPVPDWH